MTIRMDYRITLAVENDGIGQHIKDVFLACYEEIINRRITTIVELRDYVAEIPWHPGVDKIIRKCARLIRELNWGMFRDLDSDRYPKLWKALVIPDRHYRDIGDLKRNTSGPDLFCTIMDIHAYTEFCRRHRHNFSMLNVLDGIIEKDIHDIAKKSDCLSYRAAGDNIVVIGTSATDIINATLGIQDCFSRRRVIKDSKLSEARRGKSIVLQDLKVTAGIAGGENYSSLLITANGDVSGTIVNTAARLQSFANFLAPDRSKVLVTSHVHADVQRERRSNGEEAPGYEFFACGRVYFKGLELTVYEILSMEEEFKKLRYQKELTRLQQTMGGGGWKDRILQEAMRLVVHALRTVPVTKVEVVFDDERKVYTTSTISNFAEHTLETYESDRDHRRMAKRLLRLMRMVEDVRGFDRLVLVLFRQVVEMFDKITLEFESIQYQKIRENEVGLFTVEERKVLANADRFELARQQLIERGKGNNNIYSTTVLWNKVIGEAEKNWDFRVYSGKR